MGKIEIWAVQTDDTEKQFWSRRQETTTDAEKSSSLQLIEVDGSQIRARIAELIGQFDGLVSERPADARLVVDEIELALVVNAKGGVQLITKLEAGAEASIRVKLKRAKE